MKVIGLTGGIGTGKSTVSAYLKDKDYSVIDADSIAHHITLPGSPILRELASVFGDDIINSDGTLNRRLLGTRAFKNEASQKILNTITHKEIMRIIENKLSEYRHEKNAVVFLDAPLLFEAGIQKMTDIVWVVSASDEVRLSRIIKRDGLTEREIRDRINRQMPSAEKENKADVVIYNDGTKDELFNTIDKLLEEYV